MEEQEIEKIINKIEENTYLFTMFLESVKQFFLTHPRLQAYPSLVHSVKSRVKSRLSLKDKIKRKSSNGNIITGDNVFDRLTDIVGIRVLHLYQSQFNSIHECVMNQVKSREWVLFEKPIAYTWDPEAKKFFENHRLKVTLKDSFYTSVHYVIKPTKTSPVTCEVQVRTLFEEIWGEIDHSINYPIQTGSLACREQLLVLAKMVGAGSRLAESIFRVDHEFKATKN